VSDAEVQAEPENVVLKHVPAGPTFEGSDEQKIRAAMAEVRAERGERPRDEIKVWDGQADPLPDPRAEGRHEGGWS
jgi:hypothetical protein